MQRACGDAMFMTSTVLQCEIVEIAEKKEKFEAVGFGNWIGDASANSCLLEENIISVIRPRNHYLTGTKGPESREIVPVTKTDETTDDVKDLQKQSVVSQVKNSSTQLEERPETPPSTSLLLPAETPSTFRELHSQVKSSPYDPTRTPQFIHSRPSEPLENALRFPNNSQALCSLVLSPPGKSGHYLTDLGSPFTTRLRRGTIQESPLRDRSENGRASTLTLQASPFFKEPGTPFLWDLSQSGSSQSSSSKSFISFEEQAGHSVSSADDVFSFFNPEEADGYTKPRPTPTVIDEKTALTQKLAEFTLPFIADADFVGVSKSGNRQLSDDDLSSDDLIASPFSKKRKISVSFSDHS